MLLGVMADSHDNMPNIQKAVRFFNQKEVKAVLHAGDFIAPFVVRRLKELDSPLVGVFGNNDGEKRGLKNKITSISGEIHSPPYLFERDGRRILLVHDPEMLKQMDLSSFQLVVYGHTHQREIKKEEGKILLNPGECGGWLTGTSTVALVDLEKMEVDINLLR